MYIYIYIYMHIYMHIYYIILYHIILGSSNGAVKTVTPAVMDLA